MTKFCKFCNIEHDDWYIRPDNGKKECRVKRAFHAKRHHDSHKEDLISYKAVWQKENAEHLSEYQKDFRKTETWEKYKPIKAGKQLINDTARMKVDINFKLTRSLRSRLGSAIKGSHKHGSAVSDLGCSIEELKKHLESQFHHNPETGEVMSWDNWTIDGWHIDHIKPLSKFDLSNRKQLLEACHYSNLQPLWWFENLKKGDNV